MKWLEFSQQVPAEFVEPVSYLFHRYGRGTAIEETPGSDLVTLRTYLPGTSKWRRARLEVGVRLIGRIRPFPDLQVKEMEEGEWEEAWKRHFTLLHVGKHIVVKPSWIEYTPAPGEVIVELDPGMAFGTGHHPTTCMCLEALEDVMRPDNIVLDVGTGSGILGIAALRLGAKRVLALDVDPVAVRAAKENFRANGFSRSARVVRESLPLKQAFAYHFDVGVANINAHIIKRIAPHLADALRPGGTQVVSGILEAQAEEVRQAMEASGFQMVRTLQKEDWVALVGKRVKV